MYMLQYSETNEGFPEMEFFNYLQHALARLQALADQTSNPRFVANILLDSQDIDGQLHDICSFDMGEGFTFEKDFIIVVKD